MSIKVLIIEDERLAAKQLVRILNTLSVSFQVLEVIESKKEAILKIPQSGADLIFMDIHLSDGQSFDIFESIQCAIPIIFTTAYDKYMLQAFKQYSIDYLLKPIDPEELSQAVQKFQQHYNTTGPQQQLQQLIQHLHPSPSYKSRFLVKVGQRLRSISTDEIAYFFAKDKATYLCHQQGRNYPIDFTLKELEEQLNPEDFFRVNRTYLLARSAIGTLHYLSASKLQVSLAPSKDEITVASDRLPAFKAWLS